ncbi:MAG: glycosyltransferase [Deltaproteobacteria bacterium]|nr:glycosyltransferase [Deltaproteobacteria bacterium]
MFKQGLVSIVIEEVGFNLDRCLQSVTHQQNTDVEILIISALSEDKKNLITSACKWPITFIHNTESKNAALDRVSGEYVMFLESKYSLKLTALVELKSLLEINSAAPFVYCSVMRTEADFAGEDVEVYEQTSGPFFETKAWFRKFFPNYSLFRRSALDAEVRFKQDIPDPFRDFCQQIIKRKQIPVYLGKPLVMLAELSPESLGAGYSLYNLALSAVHHPQQFSLDLNKWALAFIDFCREIEKRVQFVFIANEESPSNQKFQILAKLLAESGELVHLYSKNQKFALIVEGMSRLALDNDSCDQIIYQLSLLGGNIVLVSDERVDLLLATRKNPAIIARVLLSSANNPLDYYGDLFIDLSSSERAAHYATVQWSSVVRYDDLADKAEIRKSLVDFCETKRKQAKENNTALFEQQIKLHGLDLNEVDDSSLELSVIVCCRNVEESRLRRCLLSLREQSSNAKVQIIISDFGSSEAKKAELLKLCSEMGAHHLYTDAKCPWARSLALNIGIQAAKAKWIMTTDADMIFAPNFFRMLASYIAEFGEKTAYYAQCVKLPPCHLPHGWRAEDVVSYVTKGRIYGREGKGGCQVASRELLMKIRGFNENYSVWGCEDEDLFERIGWAGFDRVWLRPGYYMHQWHLPNIFQSASESNKKEYQELRDHPRIIVNAESWGIHNSSKINAVAPKVSSNADFHLKTKELEERLINLEQSPFEQAKLFTELSIQALQNDQVHSALQMLQDAVFLAPQLAEAQVALATVYVRLGIYERATLCIDRALASNPSLPVALDLRRWLTEH